MRSLFSSSLSFCLLAFGCGLATALLFTSARADDYLVLATQRVEAGDADAAVRTMKKGAHEGDIRCQYVLGMWALAGTHLERDAKVAADWLTHAATRGLPIAQSNLGLLYADGLGVERDASRAAEWYRKAASHGEPLGQAALGAAYFTGSGVPRDRVEAYTWTSLAAAQGYPKALDNLAAMERELSEQEIDLARARAEAFIPRKLRGDRGWKVRLPRYDSSDSVRTRMSSTR
jgi:hypothetical protein